ncbi:MAG: glycoside hydrolase TIM-barrel-like domain-containing protein [Candidatus Rickettsia vulgarisii]
MWFTEFGFPSIDKAPNQPNVFFDPQCRDGGVPRYSSGETNISIQQKSIRSFIEYWKTQEYIEQMFLWTWDASMAAW